VAIDILKGLFFTDGCILRKDVAIVSCGFNDYPDGKNSGVLYFHGGKWRYFDVQNDAMISVSSHGDTGYIVGTAGIAIELPLSVDATLEDINEQLRMWLIRKSIKYGEITRVRVIAGQPYCCGQSGQIYRLAKNEWTRADMGLRKFDGPGFEDIDGSGPSDIYAVGIDGVMCSYKGKKWDQVDLPTNLHLSNIRCVSPDLYYVCGNDGLIMSGAGDQWKVIGELVPEKHYWGLELFENNIYLSHGSGIDRLIQGNIEAVEINIEGDLSFNRLNSCDGQLWSFGEDNILIFDGVDWSEVKIPIRRLLKKSIFA
jgi:hypothetical protein